MASVCDIPAHVDPARVVDFDLYDPPSVASGFHEAFKRLQSPDGPDVLWTPRNGGHWIAVRGNLIEEVFANYESFSSSIGMVPKADGLENRFIPANLDPPEYTAYRSIVMRAMSPRRVTGLTEEIRQLSAELIEQVRDQGECNFVTAYAEQLPIRIFLRICDLPQDDAKILKKMTDRMLKPDPEFPRAAVAKWFRDYLEPVITARRGGSGTDVLSVYANAEIDGRPLNLDELIQMSTVLLFAGLDTVVNFLSFSMHFLATHDAHREALEKDPSRIDDAVEELLRRFAIVTSARVVRHDREFGGARLLAGDMILAPTFLHGLDERCNADPMTVDFDRKNIEYSTFGQGTHRCVGLLLAKIEIRTSLEEWTSRIPGVRLAPGATVEFGSGQVGHMKSLPLVWETQAA